MAFVIKFFKTIRNNWKKSTAAVIALGFGGRYLNRKYEESLIRQQFCREAQKYGDNPLNINAKPKKLTVFLNPTAQGGQAKALFEKNVAPLLYLSGMEVNVIKTEYEGQAKSYMDLIEDTDAIVVAGGDGTVMETITGLLRRMDQKLIERVPIGIIPLGKTNSFAQLVFDRGASDVRWLAEMAMAVVKGDTKPVDVMHIKSGEGKSVFALAGLNWGAYEDAERSKKKYWYLGPLKHRWTYISTTLKEWPPVVKAKLSYILPCSGCSKCRQPPPVPTWRWWHLFLAPKVEVPKKNYSEIINEECGMEHQKDVSVVEFSLTSSNYQLDKDVDDRSMDLSTVPETVNKNDFIKEGWRRMKSKNAHTEDANKEHLPVSKVTLTPLTTEGEEAWFNIDSEEYEVMPVEVELLKEKIKVFCKQKAETS